MDVAMEALRARHRSLDRSTTINTAMIVVERAGVLIDADADAVCVGRGVSDARWHDADRPSLD
jgi:hypothetical protein